MNYKIFIVLILILISAVGCFGQNNPNKSFPDTIEGKKAKVFWTALNSKDDTILMDFIKNQMSENNEMPMKKRLESLREFRQFLNGSSFVKMARVNKQKVSFFIKTVENSYAQLDFNLDANDRVKGIGIDQVSEEDVMNFNADNSKTMTEAEFIPSVQDYLKDLVEKDEFSGAILIAKDGRPIFTEAYGYSDRASKTPNRIDTKFNLGSINKMFTSLAIGILADEGKLSFDDKIGKHLPDYPNKIAKEKVTIYQLLTMTSGIGDIFGEEYDATPKTKLRSIDSYLPLFASKPLEFEPGTNRRYSNGGYLVLGAIIEKLSGESYYDFVKNRIYKKVGMNNTDSYEVDSNTNNMALGYTSREATNEDKRKNNIDSLPAKGSSAGGGYSTLQDMLKFTQTIATDKFPVPKSLREAKGIRIADMFINGLGIGGGAPGINSVVETKLPGNYSIIIMSNYDPPTASKVSKKLRQWIGDFN